MAGLDWSSMEIVLTILEEGSLSAAAKRLRVDQSTMSRRLLALEDALGQPLFARSRRGAHPTSLAEALAPLARSMQQSMRQVEHVAALSSSGEQLQGRVRVATLETIADHVLIPALPTFFDVHPRVKISLLVGASIKDMTQLEADLAIRLIRPKTGDLTVQKLTSGGGAVFMHQDYAKAHAHRGLEELDWITWDEDHAFLPEARWLMERRGVEPRLRCSRMHSIIAALRGGLGAAVLGKQLGEQFPDLVSLEVDELAASSTALWLVRPRAHKESALIDTVGEWLTSLFEDR